jgi:hypothetical protein
MAKHGGVFISHISSEAPIADALKTYLKRCFGLGSPVFVSSDYDSISTGDEWYRAIVAGILDARAVVVLLSKYSVDARWINFEVGLALGASVRVFPLTIRHISAGDVPPPLSQLHVRNLADPLAVEGLIQAIAEVTESSIMQMDDAKAFVAGVAQIEDSLPVKSLRMEPLLERQVSGLVVRFQISNTGNRDVELIELEVAIPEAVIDPNWRPPRVPFALTTESRMIGKDKYLVLWEQPLEGGRPPEYGGFRTLPRIISPHWSPRLSGLLKIPIRQDVGLPERWSIRYKIVARDTYTEPGEVDLGRIRFLE